MDAFSRNHRGFVVAGRLNILKIFCIIMFCQLNALTAFAQEEDKVAVLPFVINASDAPDNLATSLQQILSSSISKKGYQIISSDSVNRHPMAFQTDLGSSDLKSIGRDLGSDWVVSGALAKLDEKISLDIKVDGSEAGRAPLSISIVEDSIDKIPDVADKIAESIDYHISGITFISSIQVKGNKRIEGDAILAIIDTQKGDRFDQAMLNKDVRTIYNMGYFDDVQIETEDEVNGKAVTINVIEKPFITKIAFEGNKEYKEDKLTEEIGLKKFAVLNLSDVKQSINTLLEFYKKNGYYNAAITYKVQDLPNNEAVLTYIVDEGEKVHITKIEFLGNEVYTDKELIKLMKTKKKGFFYWLTNSGVLEQNKLEYDVYQLTSYYHNQGYINARIGAPDIVYDKEKGLTITMTIDEGKRYKVGEVHITGDMIKPEEEMLERINLNKQEYFSNEVLFDDIEILKNICANEGYAYSDVDYVAPENDEEYKIDITFNVSKNKKVRVERINIKGNTNTRDKVIRRELKLVEGEYFSSSKLETSKNMLTRLTYLENPEIKTKEGSADDLMVLDVEVTDAQRGSFSIGAGYSSFDKLFASLGVTIDNLFGRGQSLSLDGSIGSRTTQYNLKFTEPWLFDRPISGTINLYDLETEYDDFTKDSKGASLGVGFLLGIDDYTRGSVGYSYDDAYVTSIYSSYSPYLQDMIGKNSTSSISTGISRDSRNKIWSTSRGSVNSLSMEYAGGTLGGTSAFNRYSALSSWFFPLWWNHVLMVKGSAGMVKGRSGGKLPVYERFMLGGSGSVRGYDSMSISPIDPETGYSIGGTKMMMGNIEYRIPIMESQGVIGFFFFDAGSAFIHNDDWRRMAKRSTGFGIKWWSPMGPLILEYGIKLDREPGESAGEFEFSMSYD
jgi:outer membrane protein insertion porin family